MRLVGIKSILNIYRIHFLVVPEHLSVSPMVFRSGQMPTKPLLERRLITGVKDEYLWSFSVVVLCLFGENWSWQIRVKVVSVPCITA